MSATEKLREALIELKSDREKLDRQIDAIERALTDAPVRKPRGRRKKEAVAPE